MADLATASPAPESEMADLETTSSAAASEMVDLGTASPAAELAATVSTPASSEKFEKKVAKARETRAKPNHPRTSVMVNNTIKSLRKRGGSSVQAYRALDPICVCAMADLATASPPAESAAAASTPASSKKSAKKGAKAKPNHPRISEMVNNAIKSLREKGGSSLQAIKKYVAANNMVNAQKLSPFINKYLKSAVASGALVQTKGKGASGSFKLSGGVVGGGSTKQSDKKSSAAIPKKAAGRKPGSGMPKGSTAAKKAAKKAAKPKSPSKAKNTTKVHTKKPKGPKHEMAKVLAKALLTLISGA